MGAGAGAFAATDEGKGLNWAQRRCAEHGGTRAATGRAGSNQLTAAARGGPCKGGARNALSACSGAWRREVGEGSGASQRTVSSEASSIFFKAGRAGKAGLAGSGRTARTCASSE